jgi:aspartate racemase
MRTIGMIGGMSWESTATYYRLVNQGIRDRLGPLRSAELLLVSVDFGPIEAAMRAGAWDAVGATMAGAARRLEAGGADCIVLCTNTIHSVAPAIAGASALPLLHIGDAAGEGARDAGLRTVGLLGTRFTMHEPFLKDHLASHFGLRVLVPGDLRQAQLHGIIFEELCAGILREPSRAAFRDAMAELAARGAEGILLACTEIGLLVQPGDATVPLLDTTALHAAQAVAFALAEGPAMEQLS